MSRRSMLLSVLMLTLIASGVAGGMYVALTYVPHFYEVAGVASGPQRLSDSMQFEQSLYRFVNDLRYESHWQAGTTDKLVNSWLAQDFIEQNHSQWLPAGVSDPRIEFRPDVIKLGFRYGEAPWQVVVSLEAKVWLPPRETNVLVVEILSFRAGGLPLTVKALQEEFTEKAREQNVKVLWYRLGKNPVALIRFQTDKREPTIQLQGLAIGEGTLQVKGLSLDPELRRLANPSVPEPTNVEKPNGTTPPPHASPLDSPKPTAPAKWQ